MDICAIKVIMAGCSCNVVLFEPFVGYWSVPHNMPVSQSDSGISVVKITNAQWIQEQNQDPIITEVCHLYKEGKLYQHNTNSIDSHELHTMMHHKQQFVMRNNFLYKKLKSSQREYPSLQFVLPTKYWQQAFHACHNDVGHLGIERSLDLLRD